MRRMKNLLLARIAPLALAAALAGCASSGKAPASQAGGPPRAQATQISPAHPYCMFIPRAGQLRECYQFAFGRCEAWGSSCRTPGPIVRPAAEQGTAASP